MSAPARNAYIDALRGWSITGVVCVHFAGSFVTTDIHAWSPSFFLGLALNQGFGFAVPLFVFLSGVLAGQSKSQDTLAGYYLGRFWRIGAPYLLASIASFYLLNHYAAWQKLPDLGAKFKWLVQHVGFYGVEPTLYFIPLILQLYILQPALKALPRWLHRLAPAVSADRFAVVLAFLALGAHVALGWLCYNGRLSYYDWARPNALFWLFYFFAGLHFRSLVAALTPRALGRLAALGFLVAAAAMTWNWSRLLDPAVVGASFELNRLDFAYARPEMLVYDLAMVLGLAAGLALGWTARASLMSWVGRFTLEIYLWHILVLYFGAWRYAGALDACRAMPEVIVIICLAATIFIALLADAWRRGVEFAQRHRLALVKIP